MNRNAALAHSIMEQKISGVSAQQESVRASQKDKVRKLKNVRCRMSGVR
ncbi:hypothetical protein SAMN04488104_100741 [Algoriphagus faecimaris]|uniref:Uncharacterized protein n=1 Tax=Algoriphagus faecimaris TaxID=686796 RepID=A0A1G6PTM1_9BACT|nr:hypothetical protein SAMN04488104_100741 [Algoriphagus faecimaris]